MNKTLKKLKKNKQVNYVKMGKIHMLTEIVKFIDVKDIYFPEIFLQFISKKVKELK